MEKQFNKFLTLLTVLLFTFGIGNVWAADAEIIKVTLAGANGADRTVTGTIGGTSAVQSLSSSSPYKLNSDGAYVSLTLASGYFEQTDIVTITGADKAHQIYYGTPGSGTLLCTTPAQNASGEITVKLWGLPASQNTIYVYRAASSSFNGKLTTMAVTRPDLSLTGTGTISYTMTKGSAAVSRDVTNVKTLTPTSTEFAVSTLAIGSNNSKEGYCGQITGHAAAYSATQYVQLGFTIASGYTFTPSAASIIVFANSTSNMKAKVVISDGTTSIESNELSCASSDDSSIEFASGAFTGKALSGNVTITIYQWGVTSKRAYIKSPVTITGTVAVAAACTEAPDAPTGLVAAPTGDGATFTITDAANTNNYEIVCKTTSGTPAGDATPTQTGTSKTITVTGLNAATEYYAWVRSVCDATHKSSWFALGDGGKFTTLTPITPTLSYANNPLVLTVRTTGIPTLSGNTGSGAVTWNSSAEGVATVDESGNITAVAAGTTTITASIAANGGYAAGEATATVKVAAAPLGIIDQKLATGDVAWDASVIVTSDYTNVTSLTALSQHGSATASGNGNTSNGGQTSKIGTASGDFNDANYLELAFTIKSGMEFEVSSVTIPVQPVSSGTNNFKAVLSDGTTDIEGTSTNLEAGKLNNITFSSFGTLTGNVTLKIYAWGWTNGYRLGKNIVIDGEIKAPGACTTPTIAWDGDQPADAFVSDGSKTFTVTSNYAAGIDFELSSNTCGATVAVEPETGNLHWVVSFTGAGSVTITPKVVGDGTTYCVGPVSATAKTLTVAVGHDVTFNMKGHGASIAKQTVAEGGKATKPNEPTAMGYNFGGWYKEAGCENAWDFATDVVNTDTELFAKWTAFAGCTELWPATSGDAPTAAGQEIVLQSGSTGGHIYTVSAKSDKFNESFEYTMHGLALKKGSDDVISVTLGNDLDENSKISVTLVAANTGARGLNLLNATGGKVKGGTTLGWADATVGAVETFSYTVEAGDGLEGTNVFRLQRNNSVYLKCLKVESCGASVIYHNLTSAVNIAGKGTVTLGASSVREGHTTTATYSDIDAAYEFVSWSISGAGASIADATANPATITMGTEDAVVTLNLQVKPVYYTVTYYDGASEMGTEQVAENGHPTATGIATKKLGYNFLGWSEIDGGAVVNLNDITITAAKNLYAKYEAVVCPTSGTVYKFQMKTDLVNGNVFDSKPNSVAFTTDNYLSVLTGGILTGSIDNNNVNRLQFFDNKAVGFASGSGGTLTIGLDCALEEGDVIKYINYANSNNKMTLSDAIHTQTLDGNGTEEVQTWDVPAAWAGATELTLVRGGNTPKLTYFEIYRRPVATGATLADLTIRQGQSKTPVMTLEPSADARVTSQVWEIVGTPTNLTGAAINPATGAITTGTLDDPLSTGSISVKVTLNGSIVATCTATVVGNIDQQNVTKSTIWNWQNTGATANIELTNSTDPKRNEAFVLANVAVNNDADFESDKLVVEGQHMVRDYDNTNPYFQGQLIQFHTTVAGKVRVKFSHTGNATAEKPARELYINGTATGETRDNATPAWSSYIEVPAGDVSITAYYVNLLPEATQQYIRVFEIEFLALAHQRTSGYAAGDLGTVCLEDATIIEGANLYELAGLDQYGYLAFDQILSGELEAGKPYLFEVTNPSNISFYKPVGAAHTDTEETTGTNGMIGSFAGTTLYQNVDQNYYYFSGRHIWRVNDFTVGIPIPAHRCYVDMDVLKAAVAPAPMPGRVRMTIGVNGKNTPTAIDNAEASDKPAKMLINGQLFILRGDKTYDVTGKLVK